MRRFLSTLALLVGAGVLSLSSTLALPLAAQQISELKLAGLKNIVPLPADLQKDLVLTAATVQGTARADDVKKIVELLASHDAAQAYANAGLKAFEN